MITKLEASAFKGLRSLQIEPRHLNLVIGANGTGKTNFTDLIEFISWACRFGLKEAVDRNGGLDEVRTKMSGRGQKPILACSIMLDKDSSRGIQHVQYSFKLTRSNLLAVDEERLSAIVYPRSAGKPPFPGGVNYDSSKPVEIFFARNKQNIIEWSPKLGPAPTEAIDPQNLLLNIYGKVGNFRNISEYLSSMRVYNIDAQLAKMSDNGGDTELERTGSNMSAVLKRAAENKRLRDTLLDNLRTAVPYIKNMTPETLLTYKTLKFTELDSKLQFRAQQMSDGTIRLLGLLSIFSKPMPPPVVVIEEPENALHSYAVKQFVQIATAASLAKKFPTQIFFTTHSPVVFDAVLRLENWHEVPPQCFVTRRRVGASTIEPASSKIIEAIQKNLGRPSQFLQEGSFEDSPYPIDLHDERNS